MVERGISPQKLPRLQPAGGGEKCNNHRRKAVMTEKVGQNANDTVISEILEMNPELEGIGNYEYGWADSDEAGQVAKRGLDEDVVRDISAKKN